MKRLLCTTAALSLAFAPIQPWPLMAQDMLSDLTLSTTDDGRITDKDGTVLCIPTEAQECDLLGLEQLLSDAEQSGGEAGRAAAITALSEAVKANEATAQSDAAAAEQAAADAAQAEADAAAKAAIDAAQAEEDAAAQAAADAAQAEADAAAQATADAAQAEADAAAQAAADAAQAEADAAAQGTADAAQAEADAAAQAAIEAAQAEADAAAQGSADAAQAEADAAAQAEADAAAQAAIDAAQAEADQGVAEADLPLVTAPEATAEPTQDAVADAPLEPISDDAEAALAAGAAAEAEARAADASAANVPAAEPVDIPVVSENQISTLSDLLANPDVMGAEGVGAAAALLGGAFGNAPTEAVPEGDDAQAGPADVTVTTVTEADTRASFEEFAAAPTVVEGGKKKSGLSDLEKVGLVALGALVVGAALSNGREVVANTGDRVVVKDDQGGYQVYKDDDTLLRRPGATVRTESYRDGSTRSIVARKDGTEVVTIRDASGRVLRRATYDQNGNEVILIDDMAPETTIDVTTLPRPREDRVTISTRDSDASLKAALARAEAEKIGRAFSLRQIREIKEVRRLAATIDVENITFETNSAVIRTTEARKLADLGRIMNDILDGSPDEVFLIEGHTDAVGSAVSNLTLSDRRAESVALALTEYFNIPPENLVVQGYGESDLRIASQADERLNRRVAVRVVTPLLRTASR